MQKEEEEEKKRAGNFFGPKNNAETVESISGS